MVEQLRGIIRYGGFMSFNINIIFVRALLLEILLQFFLVLLGTLRLKHSHSKINSLNIEIEKSQTIHSIRSHHD